MTTPTLVTAVLYAADNGDLRIGLAEEGVSPIRVHGPEGIETIAPAAIVEPGDPRATDIDYLTFKCEDFLGDIMIGPASVRQKSKAGSLRLKRFSADMPMPVWVRDSDVARLAAAFGVGIDG